MLDHKEFGLVDFFLPVAGCQLQQGWHSLAVEIGVLLLGVVLERHLLGATQDGGAREERQRQETHSWLVEVARRVTQMCLVYRSERYGRVEAV